MRRLRAGSLVATLLTACASLGGGGDGEGVEKTHYLLRMGEPVPQPSPLPQGRQILVEWHYSDGSTQVVEGFRGWDFNGDERFEMVEVLTMEGRVQSRLFDFDGDGRIDQVKEGPKP